jgi:hypothetical protein
MEELHRLAARLDAAGTAVTAAASGLHGLSEAAQAFGGDAPGRIGDLGRQVHAQWTTACSSRVAEAERAAGRLADLAVGLRFVADSYGAVDADAAGRLGREEP